MNWLQVPLSESSFIYQVSSDRRASVFSFKHSSREDCCLLWCLARPLILFKGYRTLVLIYRAMLKINSSIVWLFICSRDSSASRHGIIHEMNIILVRVKTYFRTFQKQDTKSKFFEMEAEFESRNDRRPTLSLTPIPQERKISFRRSAERKNVFAIFSFLSRSQLTERKVNGKACGKKKKH